MMVTDLEVKPCRPSRRGAQRSALVPPQKLSGRCLGCTMAQTGCQGGFPCKRCFKKCIQCEFPNAGVSCCLERAVSSHDPRQIAMAFVGALRGFSISEAGKASLLRYMRAWHSMNKREGLDLTWGLLDAALTQLGTSTADLDAHTPAPTARGASSASSDETTAMSLALARSPTFRALDDGVCLLAGWVPNDRGQALALNGVAVRSFCTPTELAACLERHKILPLYALASMMCPDDWACFAESWVRVVIGEPPGTSLVKLSDRDGNIRIHVSRCRRVRFEGVQSGGVEGFVIVFEAMPSSRHLTPTIGPERAEPPAALRLVQTAAAPAPQAPPLALPLAPPNCSLPLPGRAPTSNTNKRRADVPAEALADACARQAAAALAHAPLPHGLMPPVSLPLPHGLPLPLLPHGGPLGLGTAPPQLQLQLQQQPGMWVATPPAPFMPMFAPAPAPMPTGAGVPAPQQQQQQQQQPVHAAGGLIAGEWAAVGPLEDLDESELMDLLDDAGFIGDPPGE